MVRILLSHEFLHRVRIPRLIIIVLRSILISSSRLRQSAVSFLWDFSPQHGMQFHTIPFVPSVSLSNHPHNFIIPEAHSGICDLNPIELSGRK